jgi:hypothetical protein
LTSSLGLRQHAFKSASQIHNRDHSLFRRLV